MRIEEKIDKAVERLLISQKDLLQVENQIRFQEHLRRYAAVRRFCYGKVLDFACGCGYGTHIISKNPDVTSVTGVDLDETAINWAINEYKDSKVDYLKMDINNYNEQVDTLVSLESIEHFEDKTLLPRLAKRTNAKQIIISYPNKKSTHFNPFHVYDYTIQEVNDLFNEHLLYHKFTMGDVQFLLYLKLPENFPHHIVKSIQDLNTF